MALALLIEGICLETECLPLAEPLSAASCTWGGEVERSAEPLPGISCRALPAVLSLGCSMGVMAPASTPGLEV